MAAIDTARTLLHEAWGMAQDTGQADLLLRIDELLAGEVQTRRDYLSVANAALDELRARTNCPPGLGIVQTLEHVLAWVREVQDRAGAVLGDGTRPAECGDEVYASCHADKPGACQTCCWEEDIPLINYRVSPELVQRTIARVRAARAREARP